jgi:hypothetical protein
MCFKYSHVGKHANWMEHTFAGGGASARPKDSKIFDSTLAAGVPSEVAMVFVAVVIRGGRAGA